MTLIPVLLCGGSGTRLWPLSRTQAPKQFMDIGGTSLFDDTLHRVRSIAQATKPLIVCNDSQRFLAGAHMQQHGGALGIILEPQGRNTAPAIALAAHVAQTQCQNQTDDPVLLVLPSDHRIPDTTRFVLAMEQALPIALNGHMVTFGITPTEPSSGFGYIEQGPALPDYPWAYTVSRFCEKPDVATATAMLEQGGYSWNSGMFMFRASVFLNELAKHAPKIAAACAKACSSLELDGDFIRPNKDAFMSSPADSIDYAVMEHTTRCVTMPLNLEWSDLGSWNAFYESAPHDNSGNTCVGDVLCLDSATSYIHSTHRLVAALGLDNMLVVESADAVLVAPMKRAQDVKHIVNQLALTERVEKDQHVTVFRPWGSYEVLKVGQGFQVKRIVVTPNGRLSLQYHNHRAEHWVVVSGVATVTVGTEQSLLQTGQSIYIGKGQLHRLENATKEPLIIIEVQTGDYLEEDDIVRCEDAYGRV